MDGPRETPSASHAPALLAEINVTPMVDVMLVLLIIFMITAPLATAGIEVDMPQGSAKSIAADSTPIEISIDANGRVFLGRDNVEAAQFDQAIATLAAATPNLADTRVFVRADRKLDYGYVLGIVNTVSSAGFTKVAFLSEPVAPPEGNLAQ